MVCMFFILQMFNTCSFSGKTKIQTISTIKWTSTDATTNFTGTSKDTRLSGWLAYMQLKNKFHCIFSSMLIAVYASNYDKLKHHLGQFVQVSEGRITRCKCLLCFLFPHIQKTFNCVKLDATTLTVTNLVFCDVLLSLITSCDAI